MKIAILGTRGIPNNYGGFEQLAEYLSVGLSDRGHQVYVYSPHNHPYTNKEWNGVNIIHKYDPEYKIGTSGQFVYDLNCILDTHNHNFDIILQLGYTSSSIWSRLFPKKSIVITNMDGLEWKRTKFTKSIQKFIKMAERLAIKHSDAFIADSIGIQAYLKSTYNKDSTYIAYGADLFNMPSKEVLTKYKLSAFQYDMLIARLEPENSIEVILDGVENSTCSRPFLVIGNNGSKYGAYLMNKYQNPRIKFIGAIYNIDDLNNLRSHSNLYFHGHTVGGTNPSLLEAMASNCLICANQNEFNASILGEDAYYFLNSEDVRWHIENIARTDYHGEKVKSNRDKIASQFSWELIIQQYEDCFLQSLKLNRTYKHG